MSGTRERGSGTRGRGSGVRDSRGETRDRRRLRERALCWCWAIAALAEDAAHGLWATSRRRAGAVLDRLFAPFRATTTALVRLPASLPSASAASALPTPRAATAVGNAVSRGTGGAGAGGNRSVPNGQDGTGTLYHAAPDRDGWLTTRELGAAVREALVSCTDLADDDVDHLSTYVDPRHLAAITSAEAYGSIAFDVEGYEVSVRPDGRIVIDEQGVDRRPFLKVAAVLVAGSAAATQVEQAAETGGGGGWDRNLGAVFGYGGRDVAEAADGPASAGAAGIDSTTADPTPTAAVTVLDGDAAGAPPPSPTPRPTPDPDGGTTASATGSGSGTTPTSTPAADSGSSGGGTSGAGSAASSGSAGTPTPTETDSATATPEPTATATPTPTETESATATPEPTATASTPDGTPTPDGTTDRSGAPSFGRQTYGEYGFGGVVVVDPQ